MSNCSGSGSSKGGGGASAKSAGGGVKNVNNGDYQRDVEAVIIDANKMVDEDRKRQKDFLDNLTKNEENAYNGYIGQDYVEMNQMTRGQAWHPEVYQKVTDFKKAIDEKGTSLEQGTVIYRGVYDPNFKYIDPTKIRAGDKYEDNGFVSFAMNPNTALTFAAVGVGKKNASGSNGSIILRTRVVSDKKFAPGAVSENEVIANKIKGTVKNIRLDKNGTYVIDLDLEE